MDTSKAALCAVATIIATLLLAKSDGAWAKVFSFRVQKAEASEDGLAPGETAADAGGRGTR